MPKLLEFTQFVVYCYVPWWLACPLPASAPMNDIKLISVLDKYKTHNAQIATSALKAMLGDYGHLIHRHCVRISKAKSIFNLGFHA